jgi:hypothetical protein
VQSYSRHVSKRTAAVCALLLVVVTVAAPSSCRGSSVRRPSCGEFQAKPLNSNGEYSRTKKYEQEE